MSKKIKKTNNSSSRLMKNIIKRDNIKLEKYEYPFLKSFINSLIIEQGENTEEPISSPDNFTPEQNQEDFEKSFTSPEANPENFEVEGISPNVTHQNIQQIKTWADKLDEFANFLNDPDKGTSLHRILADSDRPGSLLRGVTRKATDSITRIAGEIEKLKEVLNSFIITAPKKMRDSQQGNNQL
jgi:hypothetical protein